MIREFFDWLEDWMDDSNMLIEFGKISLVFGIFLIVVFAAVIGPMVYYDSRQPAFTLQKSDWSCTASHLEYHPVLVGKVLVPQEERVCDNYTRIQ